MWLIRNILHLNAVLFLLPVLFGCNSEPNKAEVQGRLSLIASELDTHYGMPVSSTGSEIEFVLRKEGKVIPLADFLKALNIEFEQPLIDHWGNPIMVEIREVVIDDISAYCRLSIISEGDYPRTRDWRRTTLSRPAALDLQFTNNVGRRHPEETPGYGVP